MKTFPLSFRLSSLVLATVLATPLAAQAQNIAIVNGKAVPKARVEALMSQALRQGNQQRTPELEQQVRDEVVLREMFMQEAEKRGLAASADYKAQMEFARQSILIRELFADHQKKNPVTDAEVQAEYDKFKSQSGGTEYRARHILVEKEDEAKALIAQIKGGAKFEDLRPASMRSWRSQRAAMPRSCVTSTSVVPASRLSSNISSITFSPVAKSRLPVGSSASSTAGCTTKARASATRCCSPPDSTFG
jgi:Skp family chaperone for outer membrane proteins